MSNESFSILYKSQKRMVTLLQAGIQPNKGIPSLGFYKWFNTGNFSIAIWSPEDEDMLLIQLWEDWVCGGHHVGFHRYKQRSQFGIPDLWSRKAIGTTMWPYNDIVHEGIRITHRGRPYRGTTWHIIYSDHQNFVEELSRTITTNDPPSPGPYIPLELTDEDIHGADRCWIHGVPIFGKSWSSKRGLSADWSGDTIGFFSIPSGRGRPNGDSPLDSKRVIKFPHDVTCSKRDVSMPQHLQDVMEQGARQWDDPDQHSPYRFEETLTLQPTMVDFLQPDLVEVLIHVQPSTIPGSWIAQEHETGKWGLVSMNAVRRVGMTHPADEL